MEQKIWDKFYDDIIFCYPLMMIKVVIDPEECTDCGLCYNDECPDVFEEGDGTSQLREEFRTEGPYEGEVPSDLEECVRNAADSCPVEAIIIE